MVYALQQVDIDAFKRDGVVVLHALLDGEWLDVLDSAQFPLLIST